MEQPQDFDLMLIRSDAEQYEVPAFATASRRMQREHAGDYCRRLYT